MYRSALTLSLFYALSCLSPAAVAVAQESPAQWLARIFDPATLRIAPFPGAALNRKLSVDAIQLERGGNKRIAIFIITPDQLKAAAEHFEKQFGVPPQVTGENSPFVTYTFDFASQGPAQLKGLSVVITRSPFVDKKGQIVMEYLPPAGQDAPAK
ncbi:MAG TPA: hypothetical protein VF515_15945 [Candidatus Binatia bacterium]|jgi:hypothetical protein